MINLKKNERGFVLPLTIVLVLVLGISGMGFLQLDYLEQVSTLNESSNFSGFYLANTGIERARENFKIPNSLDWTTILNGSDPNYPTDTNPNPLLCPDTSRGCVIPPFQTNAKNPGIITNITMNGNSITAPDLPFAGTFDDGFYSIRAYNDEPTTTDTNGRLTFRALGRVRDEQKVIEVTVRATSGLNLINCEIGPNCPEKNNPSLPADCVSPYCLPSDGRDPEVGPVPTLDYPLSDSNNYYRQPSNFSAYSYTSLVLNGSGECNITSSTSDTIFFCNGTLFVESGVALTNSIIIGVNSVVLKGSASINNSNTAPLPYPTIISNGNITTSSGSSGPNTATVYGTIYSSAGTVDLGPTEVHGVIIGDHVALQGFGSTVYTDDNNQAYYDFMPGFNYPDDKKTTATVASTWREIQ